MGSSWCLVCTPGQRSKVIENSLIQGIEAKKYLLFTMLALAFGVLYAFVLPPLQAPDEFAHFFRAYSVSEGYLVSPDDIPVPRSVEQIAEEYPGHDEKQAPLQLSHLRAFLVSRLNPNDIVKVRAEAMNIYIFFPYLPGATGIALGRALHLSGLGLLYAARLANLCVFVLLVLLALHLLPDFHSVLLGLALTPTALHQAASASWDSFCYAAAFLFVAYILRLAFGNQQGPLRPAQYLILGSLVALNALLKMNVCLSLLMLLIPWRRFGDLRRKCVALAGFATVIGVEIVLWRSIDGSEFEAYRLARLRSEIDLGENLRFLEFQPRLFLTAIERT